MSKRILSLVLTLALVLGSFSMAFAAPSDVVGTPAEDAVERLGNLGILEGYTDGTFKPDNNITRAEFAAVVARATGLEKAAIKGQTAFGDVPASHWASGYVRVAEGAGLIKGMGKVNGVNTFAPEANISYEQAVTMVVRALGYEPAALENGGYPTGHLIVASREGLLQDVNGVAGQLATRALVAQLVDNALEIPKMIAVAYDGKTKYVKSGAEGTKEQFLFNDLQLNSIEGVLSADKDKSKVTVGNKSLIVTTKDFDYAGLDGLKVQTWYNKDDKVVSVKVLSESVVKYDAVKINKTKNIVTTVTEDKEYDFAKDDKSTVKVMVKGQASKYSDLASEYSFAKLVLDEYGDVRWIEVYNLDEMVVVSEVKGNDVKGYGNNEIADANKYKVVKDGKEISFTSLKDKDVVLYNSGEKYAAVVTKVVKGKIDTVYTDSFKFEGKNYSNTGVKYVSDKDLSDINDDVLKEMKDNGEVEAYFNFNNKPVVVNGDVKEVASNYVMMTGTATEFANRGKVYVTFDYMNAEGTKVKNEIETTASTVTPTVGNVDKDIIANTTIGQFKTLAAAGNVVKVSIDAKGKLTKIEKVFDDNKVVTSDFKLSASYVQGFKLQSNTTVFYNDSTDSNAGKYGDYKVANLTDAKKKFSEVKTASTVAPIQNSKISVDKNGNIVAIMAAKTDVAEEGTWVTGIVKDVRTTTNDKYVTLEVNGVEKEYKGKRDDVSLVSTDVNKVYDLKVTEDGAIKVVAATDSAVVVLDRAATGNELSVNKIGSTVQNPVVNLVVEGKYYETQNDGKLKKVNTSDFKATETATVYYRNDSKKFVQVVVRGAQNNVNVTGEITYINSGTVGQESIVIDGTIYKVTSDMILKSAAGAILATGTDVVNHLTNKVVVGDQVKISGNVITIVKTAAVEAGKVKVKITALPAAGSVALTDEAAIVAARADYNALTAGAKLLVDAVDAGKDTAHLVAAETKIATLKAALVDATASAAVIAKITALPAAGSVALTNEAAIKEARAAYEVLSAAAKGIVDGNATENTARLIVLETELTTLKADTLAVANAKAALTALPFASATGMNTTAPVIEKPTVAGITFAFTAVPSAVTTPGTLTTGKAVITANDATITRDSAVPFTFEIEVNITKGNASDKVVFVVTVPTGLSDVTMTVK